MKAIHYLILLGTLFLLKAPDSSAAGTVKDYSFYSKAMQKKMNCRVYLPGDYKPMDPGTRFPVIYFLHGASLGYDSYDPLFLILDNMILFGLIKPVIVVLPDGLAPPYNGSFYTNSALYGNFEDYISHDLVAFTDSAFHTWAEPGKRGIMGASMGGYGALKIAFKHQDQYIGVAGHSGPVNTALMDIFIPDLISENGGTAPFHWSPGSGKPLTNLTYSMAGAFSPNLGKQYLVDFPLDSMAQPIPEVMERWKTENVSEIARIFHPGPRLGIIFDCGNADDYYLYYQNRSLADTLKKYNINYKYEEYAGDHTSGLPIRATLSLLYFDNLFLTSGTGDIALETEPGWKIFPNPASSILTVSATRPLQSGEQGFQLADATGRLVISRLLSDGFTEINTAKLADGLYFYKVRCGNTIQTGKTMIAH